MKAIIFSILAGLGFGGSMFLRKLSVKEIGLPAFILEAVTEAILAVFLVSLLFSFNLGQLFSKTSGIIFGVLGGLSICIGVMSFFLAAKYGSVVLPSVVGPSLGAIVASLLAVFILGEALSPIKIFGLILALVGLSIFVGTK